MTSHRVASEWEVTLQSPDGKEIKEKVAAFWSPVFDGVKESIALAARCQATIRNKGNIQFQVLGRPKLLTPIEVG